MKKEVIKSDFGTYYKTSMSKYIIEVNDFTFYFSTEIRYLKFKNNYSNYVEKRQGREQATTLGKVDLADYYLIRYYISVEKSRSYFTYKDKEYTINNIHLKCLLLDEGE